MSGDSSSSGNLLPATPSPPVTSLLSPGKQLRPSMSRPVTPHHWHLKKAFPIPPHHHPTRSPVHEESYKHWHASTPPPLSPIFALISSDSFKHSPPLCLQVACYIRIGATTGAIDRTNYLCILSNNLFNQKYFLVLWLWWFALIGVSVLGLIYRFARIMIPDLSR